MNSNLNNDTGDLVLQLRNNGTGTELCMIIDGDYYSMGNKVLNAANFSSYALPLAGGTMNGTIWSAHVYPKTTLSYNFGSSEYEYNATFSRTIFVRHIEPAKNVNDDIYLNYGSRNGCVRVWSALSMEGVASIHNLPIDGGIFWNPYVESAEDDTDAASITLHANGVGGGTELRLTMANDPDDVINLNPASWVYLKSKATFRVDDSWLRINETGSFGSGVYFGPSEVRTDNCFRIGDNGSAFGAYNNGDMWCAFRLIVGDRGVSFWKDSEGGNIEIFSGNGHTNSWQIDSYNGNLRLYTYRESDGVFCGNTLYQTDGFWANAYWASQAGTLARGGNGAYPMTFHWSGQDGQPSWLWGGNDGTNMYVYNPANFSVNYANSCYRSSYTYYVDNFSTSDPQNDSVDSFRVSTIDEYGVSSPSINPTGDWYHHFTKGGKYSFDLATAYHSDYYFVRRKVNGTLQPYQRVVTGPAQIYGSSLPGAASDGNVFFLI